MRRIAAALVGLLASACALAGAATTSAAAPLAYLALNCKQDVHAANGRPVQLSRLAVSGFVGDAIQATAKSLPTVNALAGSTAFNLGPALPVGTVGDDPVITGKAIADVVVPAAASLPQFASNKDAGLAALRKIVTDNCGMAINPTEAGQDGAGDQGPGDATGNPGTGVAGAGYKNPDQLWLYTPEKLTGRTPLRDYSGIPAAAPGAWSPSPSARYGSAVPGYTPQFGLVGAHDDQGLRTAGNAEVLPVSHPDGIGLPVLLAVLALSVVTGTLVRTWVLRRA
ncbi:hypothetical protein [Labedaea rhizosphaerae]|uniref:Uncharacterized protein n=1 Tax=Labedaea rhizosphaerae TaxID=598644 RepID=A0A4R6SNQ5_LABRH|nr:hypothetical protein [Labedaea rhizosphaerae]TDQ05220.1 hypothetical protein EV186_1011188 [Labedaea rhizosphaerae]